MYNYTIKKVTELIIEKYPDIKPVEDTKQIPENALWMCGQISLMDDVRKADRWIGYVLGALEAVNIIENNSISRDWVRKDVKLDK